MSRRRVAVKRKILPDPRYGSGRLSKFINVMMVDGKKSVAERIVYGALSDIEKRRGSNPIEVFEEAIENVRPQVEVKSRRVGGANYQVPIEVRADRAIALAMRWICVAMRAGSEKSSSRNLSNELVEASGGRGKAVKKRDDTHRMAAANKAFAHFRY
ncbi:30S ribosomal protein S7 [Candidatus Persebacteraceae bacterium Df01]|jgi:small subunit ribosomal protein S7|uniref:Small ribosomal subunit protein uS7 n=1 Tax=Candidatus Doriopsillibacter californiensis TaxID=2970740 RepID=A0ABT7QKQ9_9GAMM|nr:30S ribosomal protein S7 [Candidatus Persebacteraceae bacterium Df01]